MKKARELTDLELAFAHNNGIELLADRDLIERLEQGNAHTIADTWFQEFTNVHRRLFNSRTFNHDCERPGIIWKGLGRSVSQTLGTLVTQLFDKEGFARRPSRKQLAAYLADAYMNLSRTQLFEHGGELALRTFFTLLGKTKALTDSTGQKLDIDFTRLNLEDRQTLLSQEIEHRPAVDQVLEKLLDGSKKDRGTSSLTSDQRWHPLPESEYEIVQKHFLFHTDGDTKCLVAINGGLVPLDAVLGDINQHINREGHPADFMVTRKQIIGYLIEDGREKADSIDGIPITDEAIPLFPLNIDLLTGLDVTTQLPDVKEYCRQHYTHILRLPEYILAHKDDFDGLPISLRRRLERAEKRVKSTRGIIWRSIENAFKGKSSVAEGQKPKIFMTMGGTGSGKSNLASIAKQHTAGHCVEASLDEARTNFLAYDLYAAVGHELPGSEQAKNRKPVRKGHHFGDYIALETAAGFIREGIVERAMGYPGNYAFIPNPQPDKTKRYHLLYDGSGIPYKGKYEKIIRNLHDNGFETYILVADAPIEKAYERARLRLKGADGRAVPPKVIVEKHRGLPKSMRDAAKDQYVDHFEVMDTSKDVKGEHYRLVRRFTMPLAKVKELENAREAKHHTPEALFVTMHDAGYLPVDVKHAPDGWKQRVEFVVVEHDHHGKEKYSKVLIITDVERMAAISRKGALNPDASGLADLRSLHQPFELAEEDHGHVVKGQPGGSSGINLEVASPSPASDQSKMHEQSESAATGNSITEQQPSTNNFTTNVGRLVESRSDFETKAKQLTSD